MLINKYINEYLEAVGDAAQNGSKCADPRLWIATQFLNDEGVKPWEPEFKNVQARLIADGEKAILYTLQYQFDFLTAIQEGDRAKIAMHAEETVDGVLNKLRNL